jgi:hypothetical protein
VIYIHKGILSSLKKEGNILLCYNMTESWGYYVKWNKSEKDILSFYLYEVSRSSQIHRNSTVVITRNRGGEERGVIVLMGIEF